MTDSKDCILKGVRVIMLSDIIKASYIFNSDSSFFNLWYEIKHFDDIILENTF